MFLMEMLEEQGMVGSAEGLVLRLSPKGQRAQLRESTWESYMLNVKRHIVPALGSVTLQNLTSPRLNALYADLLESGGRDGKGRLSPRTARYVHTIIRKALKDAVRWNQQQRCRTMP